jgi:hypothetical protein
LNFGHSYLFEPALARLGRCIASYVSISQLVGVSMSGLHMVWARDLIFGAWNFHDLCYLIKVIYSNLFPV